jgi:hypothetical protein
VATAVLEGNNKADEASPGEVVVSFFASFRSSSKLVICLLYKCIIVDSKVAGASYL